MKYFFAVILFCIMSLNLLADKNYEDSGYFLSFSQKGQLIWRGQIQGDDGNWYDIRIVPGYVTPSKYAWENWGNVTDSFGEYLDSEKYRNLSRHSRDAYDWAFNDCVNKFIIKGVPNAWSEYFGAASNKVEKRIFGWPMAYPIATFQVFVDNIFRVTAGFTGCVLGATAGTVLVPGYHVLDSTVKGTYYFVGPGMVMPVSGYAWNTVISPPLALTGQKPSEQRVDGYWVKRISHEEHDAMTKDIDENELSAIAEWGKIIYEKLNKYEDERLAADKEYSKRVAELYEQNNKKKQVLSKEEENEYQKLLNSSENTEIVNRLRETGTNDYTIRVNYSKIKKNLLDKNMDNAQAMKVYNLLRKYSKKNDGTRGKTDPVRESIQVIKNADK